MSTPSCLVCSSPQPVHCLDLKTPAGKIAYFRCPECSLVFQDPEADFKEQDVYNADYIRKRSQSPDDPGIAKPREKTAEHYYRWIERYVSQGNLLEVGCATGISLRIAQDHGWKVFGVEVNGSAALIANKVLKADVVRVGNLNDAMFPDHYFSLVTLFDVIEHIPRPIEFMKILHRKIKPGGSVFFLTPNIDTISFKLLKEKWPHLVAEHLLLYSPLSMERLLKASGFTVKTHGWATKYISIGMLKTHAQNHPNSFFYKPISRLLSTASAIDQGIFPFNLGEMFVLASRD